MREIKFRAWNKNRKEYELLDSLFEMQKMNLAGYEYNERIFEQYTCLKDKNGVEIYEGDIVKFIFIERQTERIGEVFFKMTGSIEFCFKVKKQGNFGLNSNDVQSYEIIGNIHENKDLLNA